MGEPFAHYRMGDFKVGERVRHVGMNEAGVVTRADTTVDVSYDRKDAKGRNWSGKYDRNWFEQVGLLVKV